MFVEGRGRIETQAKSQMRVSLCQLKIPQARKSVKASPSRIQGAYIHYCTHTHRAPQSSTGLV